MNEMQKHTASLLKEDQTVIAAVSGGADSMAMLHCLCHCGIPISILVAHLNHRLRGSESRRDEKAVMKYCKQHRLPCIVKRMDIAQIAKKRKCSVELCGREERYRFLDALCPKGGVIATAHTLSDQAETFLLRIARGCHSAGLLGIPERRDNIIRPLLPFSRRQTEEYCRQFQIPYLQDSTNFQLITPRNRIRLKVIPPFKEINPRLEEHIYALQSHLALEEDYLSRKAKEAFMQLYQPQRGLFIDQNWHSLHKALQYRVLSLILKERNIPLSERLIQKLQRLTQTGGTLTLPGGERAEAIRNKALYFSSSKGHSAFFRYPLSLKEPSLFQNLQNLRIFVCNFSEYAKILKERENAFISALDYDKIKGNVVLRQRMPGDSLTLPKRPRKTIKKWMNEMKIPLFMRNRLGVLEDEDGVLWVQNIGVDQKAATTEQTKKALLLSWDKTACFSDLSFK